jgi:2-polyprenyl-6-methoxyphenol hydroxylase-like FAD-dependent oxidoreductase
LSNLASTETTTRSRAVQNDTILISGAGVAVAGPTLALWLTRRGFTVTVVERAPAPRAGGHSVDFRGNQLDVLRRSGLLHEVRRHQTGMGPQHVLDETGRPVVTLPPELFSGEVEIPRGDLSRILYDATRNDAEYLFGDWITSVREVGDGVEVAFAHGAPRKFDLVVGADGLHSGVRALVFGPECWFRTDTGYHFAGFTAPGMLGVDDTGLIYNVPGRGVLITGNRGGTEATVGFWFAAESLDHDRHDVEQQKKLLHDLYQGSAGRFRRCSTRCGKRTSCISTPRAKFASSATRGAGWRWSGMPAGAPDPVAAGQDWR